MSYNVKYSHSDMLKTPMASDMIPGNPNDLSGTDGCTYSGIAGYPKADDGVIKDVVFDVSGAFGSIKPAKG